MANVLHIEDNKHFRELTSSYFALHFPSVSIVSVENVLKGLEMVRTDPSIDLVISDYDLAGENGIDLLEMMQAERINKPFILLTGRDEKDFVAQALSKGVRYVIKKDQDLFNTFQTLYNIITDVTSRKKAEEARKTRDDQLIVLSKRLENSEERFRELADSLPQIIFELDLDGTFTFLNKSAYNVHHISQEEVHLGTLKVWDLIAPGEVERARQNISKALQGESQTGNEYLIRRPNGEEYPVMLFTQPIIDNGSVLGLRGIAVDITERKEMEQLIKQSEERYRALFETSYDGIAITDLTGRILEANKAFQQLIGYNLAELTQLTVRDITPEKWMTQELGIVKQEVLVKGSSLKYEKEYVRKDGSLVEVSVCLWALGGVGGQPNQICGIVRDISEVKERERRDKKEKQENTLLLDLLTHDLANYLMSAIGYTDVLQVQLGGSTLNNLLDNLKSGLMTSSSLLRNVSVLMKARVSEQHWPDIDCFNLSTGLSLALDTIRVMYPDRKIIAQLDDIEESVFVKADDLLPQMFVNVLANCVKFDRKQEVRVGIRAKKAEGGKAISVFITDYGSGIDPSQREIIFNRYLQLEKTIQGKGLGLYIVGTLADRYGGKVLVHSRVPDDHTKGTTVELILPLEYEEL